jgi:hypothetical protein
MKQDDSPTALQERNKPACINVGFAESTQENSACPASGPSWNILPTSLSKSPTGLCLGPSAGRHIKLLLWLGFVLKKVPKGFPLVTVSHPCFFSAYLSISDFYS